MPHKTIVRNGYIDLGPYAKMFPDGSFIELVPTCAGSIIVCTDTSSAAYVIDIFAKKLKAGTKVMGVPNAPLVKQGHGLGWHPSIPDIRDYMIHEPQTEDVAKLPPMVDLRSGMPPIGNQGNLGSCTAWASTAAYRYELGRQKLADFEPSELAQYYWTRQLEGSTASDAGGTIRDAVKVLAKMGAAPEEMWQYYIAKFASRPPSAVSVAAKKHLTLKYESVAQNLDTMRSTLNDGLPIIIGITVYASFESDPVAKTGVVPMPAKKEQVLGGHALLLVGYDDSKNLFTTRNSWGPNFGDKGYIYLPYDYVTNPKLANDFWALQSVE